MTSINGAGGSGGSGGGGSCNGGTTPNPKGGTDGAGGDACNQPAGTGQGSFAPHFSLIRYANFTAGAGGLGGVTSHSPGGGGGGVRYFGGGPNGADGAQGFSGKGGQGYGGGGGAGGYESSFCTFRYSGGNGAYGLVYVEWDGPCMQKSLIF